MIKVSIIGATGYVGCELVHGFSAHPEFELVHLTSRTFAGQKFSDIYPVFRGVCDIVLSDDDVEAAAKDSDLVITALPHGVSSEKVPQILSCGCKVIDHSGDFRYKNVATYEKSYKLTHPAPELLEDTVYGLPELYRKELANAKLVANPGCYPTCSILALAPFLAKGLIDTDSIIIDAISGVSGAGRKADLAYSFCETDEAFKPYGVVGHRHTTEIEEKLSFVAGKDIKVTFTPHLAPFKRGMLATIYVKPAECYKDVTTASLYDTYNEYYKGESFVRVLPEGVLPDVKAVAGSNYIDLGAAYDPATGMIKLFSAQDNLGKGAALQAIQAANCMFGLPEDTGLKNVIRGV
ncbi:MAG: N-acetyl-gamma-glutamyl-phosphate reductase [Clostridiales bacterium]|nr:N-acetyl-gamma-glutamyl-phosphate reductase [Clostridiales bacterium]